MPLRQPLSASSPTHATTSVSVDAIDSRFDLGDAYGQTQRGLARFRQALDELEQAASQLSGDADDARLGHDLELNVSESAKRVQQWLLGDQRKPVATNQYTHLAQGGPEAVTAINKLQEAAAVFARRDQTLLLMPTSASRLNDQALPALQQAITEIRTQIPELAAPVDDQTTQLAAILSAFNRESAERVFGGHQQKIEALIETAAASTEELPTSLRQQLFLDQRVIPDLNAALDTLATTKPLANLGQQLSGLPADEERHRFAIQALRSLTSKEHSLGDAFGSDSPIVLPGSAQGGAAAAAGVLITDNIEQELSQATSLHGLEADPQLTDNLIAFAARHSNLAQSVQTSLAHKAVDGGQLDIQDDGDALTVTRNDLGRLNRIITARDTAAAWMQAAKAKNTMPVGHEAMIVAASQPAADIALVHTGFRDGLGDGYRAPQDWDNDTAQMAMDIEIAVASQSQGQDSDETLDVTRLDPERLQTMANGIVSPATIEGLKSKDRVMALIERFPATAAKIDEALKNNLDRPDFQAMGVDLPTPAPAAPSPVPKLIIPGR
ncbi:MAG: hypothetical protein AAF213_05770 [Pseudomonadota bacterium]